MNFRTEFFLSDVDAGLSRTSSRDPLGFEVLWTAFGRELVPHLSTVSTGATNFVVLLVLLDSVQRYLAGRGDDGRLSFGELIVAADTLHVYAVLESPEPGTLARLLGRQRAARIRETGEVLVGPGHEVLSNQINLGLYGRYIRPLESMKLVDSESRLREAAQRRVDSLPGIGAVRTTLRAFFEELDRGAPLPFANFGGGELLRKLRSPETLGHFRGLLIEHMQVDAASEHRVRRLYEAIALAVAAGGVGPGSAEVVLKELSDDHAMENVCRLEWTLCRLDTLFETLFNVGSLTELGSFPGIADIGEELHSEGRHILKTLGENEVLSPAGRGRMNGLREATEGANAVEIAQRLVSYHTDVMTERQRAPWIDVTAGGRLVVVRSGGDTQAAVPRWRRTYYLSALADFRADLDGVPQ